MKIILIIAGAVSLGLGAAGVVLPVLPTTPFLLLAAFCFAKSSERLHTWFLGTRLYKDNLETLAAKQGMTMKAKLRVMETVTVIMAIAFIAMKSVPIGRICLAVVWTAHVIAFCFIIKTCPAEQTDEQGECTDDR